MKRKAVIAIETLVVEQDAETKKSKGGKTMKRRFGALVLALVLALALAIPAGATDAEQSPEELYQEYLSIAEKINDIYGTEVGIIPLEEMDISNMPTIEEVAEDVEEMAKLQNGLSVAYEIVSADAVNSARAGGSIGNHASSVIISGTVDSKTFKFQASGTFVISTTVGTPNYYFQGTQNTAVTKLSAPNGYLVTATENTRTSILDSGRTCYIQRAFKITKGSVVINVTPKGEFVINPGTGYITAISRGLIR